MNKTKIEWADYSWPIINGCRRVSRGCGAADGGGCYAERLAATRLVRTDKYKGLAVMTPSGPRWTGETRLWEPALLEPLKLRKPSRIFVADMGDLFYEGVRDEDIDRVFAVMALCPRHTFLVLTKRAERMYHYVNRLSKSINPLELLPWPLRGIHLGVSVEDQKTADERILWLLKMPAAKRFVSYEPALGPINFEEYIWPLCRATREEHDAQHDGGMFCEETQIDQLIIGGESGPGARPFDIQWAYAALLQCREADVACFIKQLGANPVDGSRMSLDHDRLPLRLKHKKGGDPSEWPEGLNIREYPR